MLDNEGVTDHSLSVRLDTIQKELHSLRVARAYNAVDSV